MRREKIEYGHMVEAALRTVVRDVLLKLARDEVAPPHHFYITFRTRHPRVQIADFLIERYPSEMTIVLQHQYWDLSVDDDGFGVTLSFNDQPERLYIPFAALKVFADPGVEFGLQFTIEDDEEEGEDAAVPLRHPAKPAPAPVPALDKAGDGGGKDDGDAPEKPAAAPGGAEIVALDRFRKK